ncbi:MAG: BBE domain-containing protein [Vicinamibacterales bacterium]
MEWRAVSPHRPQPFPIGPSNTTSSSCRSGPTRPTRIAISSGPERCSTRCSHTLRNRCTSTTSVMKAQRVKAAYGENYPRLVALKRAFDPDNLFRANQNVDPTRL